MELGTGEDALVRGWAPHRHGRNSVVAGLEGMRAAIDDHGLDGPLLHLLWHLLRHLLWYLLLVMHWLLHGWLRGLGQVVAGWLLIAPGAVVL